MVRSQQWRRKSCWTDAPARESSRTLAVAGRRDRDRCKRVGTASLAVVHGAPYCLHRIRMRLERLRPWHGDAQVSSGGIVLRILRSYGTCLLAIAVASACGSSETSAPTAAVSAITITVLPTPVRAGDSVAFRARLLDASGNELHDRVVSWSSSDSALLSLSGTSDSVVAEAAAMGGPVTVTASSEGQSASVTITIEPSFAAVSVGSNRACGLSGDGLAWRWGRNSSGQLGDGTTEHRSTPVRVAGNRSFVTIAVGGEHTCGVTTDGIALCWGGNPSGQLGDGTVENRLTPTVVAFAGTFADVVAGTAHTCALTSDGSAHCWGATGSDRPDHPVRRSGSPPTRSLEHSGLPRW